MVRGVLNPLNWWVPFLGIEMQPNMEKLGQRERNGENPDKVRAELHAWLKQMTRSRYYLLNTYRFKFLRKSDAVLFKLTWG